MKLTVHRRIFGQLSNRNDLSLCDGLPKSPEQLSIFCQEVNCPECERFLHLPAAGPESNLQSSPAQPTKDETQS